MPESLPAAFGRRLRAARSAAAMSVAKLALLTGIGGRCLIAWEAGDLASVVPSCDDIGRLSAALDVPPAYLAGDADAILPGSCLVLETIGSSRP